MNLQGTLASASEPGTQGEMIFPHHPITCGSVLRLEEDGSLCCEHSWAPPGDVRTQLCLDHSVAMLMIELSNEL